MKTVVKFITVSLTALSIFATLPASAEVPSDKLEEVERRKKERGGQVLGQRVGKKIGTAFELYSEDKINEALELLLELEPKGAFDKAYVDRFIGNMYAGIEGKTKIAIERLQKAKAADVLPFNDHADTLKLIGHLSLQERDFDEALKNYKEYLEFSLNENPEIYLRMANAYYESGDYKNAIIPARKAISLYKEPNQNPYIIVMASYFELKDMKSATKAVEELVKAFPENPRWWVQLGSFYMATEDYERGLSAMELAYKQGFLETENQIKQLAQLYATNGIPYKAALIQEKFVKEGLIESTKQSLSVLASTYRNAKEFRKAAEYFGKAANLSDDGEYFKDQANMLMAVEDFKSAIKAYDAALAKGVKRKGIVYMGVAEANFYLRQWKPAHKAIKLAMKEKNTAKSAASWESYIRDSAERDGVKL